MKIDFGKQLDTKYRFGSNAAVTGSFHATKKGIGFVQPEEDPDGEDMYIAEGDTLGALEGDRVSVRVIRNGFDVRNVVEEILEHHYTETCGVVSVQKNKVYVIPNNTKLPEIKIGKKHVGDAKNDDMVVVKFLSYGDGTTTGPTGAITEILGNKDAPGVDITAIVREMQIPMAFTDEEKAQAVELTEQYEAQAGTAEPGSVQAEMAAGTRRDLRSLQAVTIDEPGTRDIDDAVSLMRQGDTWELGVHIADASWFVREGTALDREARDRGTSVYLPDRIVPMLPEELSTGLCSLNAGEDRPALSVLMTISAEGEILESTVTPSMIRVVRNTDYVTVQSVLDGTAGEDVQAEYGGLAEVLKDMLALGKKLHERRRARGEIEFETPDVKVILDEKGVPVEIRAREENDAARMISDFMIAANETVAKAFSDKGVPCIYRGHEGPDEKESAALVALVRDAGGEMEMAGDRLTSAEIQSALDAAKGKDYENYVTLSTLHAMDKASYTPECRGHFGLAAPYYCHFTSPIRRYPDLVVHRLIHAYLDGALSEERTAQYREELPDLCSHLSDMEHRSIVCERDATELKVDQYLSMHIGEESDGMISGVTKWGIYVQLPDTSEGMVPVKALTDDYYDYDEEHARLVGKNTGRILRLGDTVHIRVASVDLKERAVNFDLL